MIKLLSSNIIYVTGAICSAIYDFNTKNVYSLNSIGTQIINNYLSADNDLTISDLEFIEKIKSLVNLKEINNEDYTFPSPVPKSLNFAWLELTQKCNSKCIHCYEGSNHCEPNKPLSYEEWITVIDELSLLNCKSIQFIGGEPSLYEKLAELIDYAKNKGIPEISLFTNLNNLNETLLTSIRKNNVHIHFSIYGSNSKTHDSITQVNGCFSKLVNNIKKLKKFNIDLLAHIIIMKENEFDKSNIYSLLKKLNISKIKYDEIRKVHGLCQNSHLLQKSSLLLTKPNFHANLTWFNNSYYNNTCWYGKCVISTDGNIYPCEFERSIKYGNIRKNPLSEIILGNYINKYWYWDFSKIEFCRNCEYRFACKDCRPLAYAENGNILEKNPRCKYNPYTGLWNESN